MSKNTGKPIVLEDLPILSIRNIRMVFTLNTLRVQEAIVQIKKKNIFDGTSYAVGEFKIIMSGESEGPQLNIIYDYRDENVNYTVQMCSVPSNLRIGVVYYFICPATGKKCKKLYLYQKYFVSRMAIPGVLYRIQTESKHMRQALIVDRKISKCLQMALSQQKPYFKPTYAGFDTKYRQKVQRACMLLKQYQDTRIN